MFEALTQSRTLPSAWVCVYTSVAPGEDFPRLFLCRGTGIHFRAKLLSQAKQYRATPAEIADLPFFGGFRYTPPGSGAAGYLY